ncbi:hypothetical protein BDW74DRAFT_182462 [Aspergillus multicolor]|uniref:uncharacterized protein n=1 Tax=Aspergillus multicolor TaxID=41759 RepID=UPI003CCD2C38
MAPARGSSDLPLEMILMFDIYLPNGSKKALRQTCKALCRTVRLRIDRTFLSANPLNITVFRAIADSETYRHSIKEIVWDGARLISAPLGEFHIADEREDLWIDPTTGCPEWFVTACRANRENLDMRISSLSDFKRPYWQNLQQQQADTLRANRDADALAYGLRRFSALTRITITPAAHGLVFIPLYETPMIRAFPRGFNYPIPRGWPDNADGPFTPEATPWADEATQSEYRGVGIVLRALASHADHRVSELCITANTLQTGLNCRIFDAPNAQYADFATVLRRPGFARLDLDLLVRGEEHVGWPAYRNGLLRSALAEAHDMQHISLATNMDEVSATAPDQLVPLRTIFPIKSWPSLRHFSLSQFLVDKDDLVSFLAALASTLRSRLDWRTRDPAERRVVSLAKPTLYWRIGHAFWLDKEVQGFLYGEGKNPFWGSGFEVADEGMVRDAFLLGAGWKEKNFR